MDIHIYVSACFRPETDTHVQQCPFCSSHPLPSSASPACKLCHLACPSPPAFPFRPKWPHLLPHNQSHTAQQVEVLRFLLKTDFGSSFFLVQKCDIFQKLPTYVQHVQKSASISYQKYKKIKKKGLPTDSHLTTTLFPSEKTELGI